MITDAKAKIQVYVLFIICRHLVCRNYYHSRYLLSRRYRKIVLWRIIPGAFLGDAKRGGSAAYTSNQKSIEAGYYIG